MNTQPLSEKTRPLAHAGPRLGWVGVGGFGQHLWSTLRPEDSARIAACFHPDAKKAQAAGARMRCAAFSDYAAFLRAPMDAVVLAVPNPQHAALGVPALEAGKHLFIEKPLANTVAEAEQLVSAAQRSGRVLALGHNYRRAGFVRAIKTKLEEGILGDVVMAEFNMSHGGALKFTPAQWRFHRDQCPGGPLNMLGSHLIDAANYLFGSPISAKGWCERRYAPTTAEDGAAIQILYPRGVRANITTLYSSVSTEFISIYGTQGALRFQRWPQTGLWFQPRDVQLAAATYEPIPFNPTDGIRETFTDFLEAIRDSRPPETGAQAGLDVVRVFSWILTP